jgi:hypothetical protein
MASDRRSLVSTEKIRDPTAGDQIVPFRLSDNGVEE